MNYVDKFLPTGPNVLAFLAIASPLQAIGGLLLGAVVIIAIVGILTNAFHLTMGIVGRNAEKARSAGLWLFGSIAVLIAAGSLWSSIIGTVLGAAQSVTS